MTARSTARQAALAAAVAASEISAGATAYGALLRRFHAAVIATGHAPPMLITLGGLAKRQINDALTAAGIEPLTRAEVQAVQRQGGGHV